MFILITPYGIFVMSSFGPKSYNIGFYFISEDIPSTRFVSTNLEKKKKIHGT